jgi:carboxylesterase
MPVSTEPFEWRAGERGCLLVHGLTGTPYEMRGLGERLHAAGYSVRGVCLPGHAGDVDELARCRWQDWYASLDRELDELRAHCTTVAVAGLSLGSLLSLRLAHCRPNDVAALILLSTPLVLARQRSARMAHAARTLMPALPARLRAIEKGGSDIADPEARAVHPSYPHIPLRSVAELVALQRIVRSLLPSIHQPTLAAQGRHDPTAPATNLDLLRGTLPNLQRAIVLARSEHVITVDHDRGELAAAVLDFLAATFAAADRVEAAR